MSYAQLFAQKLNTESKNGQSSTGQPNRKRENEGISVNDKKYRIPKRKIPQKVDDSRSEPDKKRPYDGNSKRPNSRARQRNSSRYQGKIPEGWIGCPEHGELIHDFILPIKVPLHQNYDNMVEKKGKLWKMKDLFQLEQKFNKKVNFCITSIIFIIGSIVRKHKKKLSMLCRRHIVIFIYEA